MMGFGDGSGISLTIYKQSAPCSRQITTTAPHNSWLVLPITCADHSQIKPERHILKHCYSCYSVAVTMHDATQYDILTADRQPA